MSRGACSFCCCRRHDVENEPANETVGGGGWDDFETDDVFVGDSRNVDPVDGDPGPRAYVVVD